MELERAAGRTIEHEVGGRMLTFSRVSTSMLIELGSHARANGAVEGKGWLTAEQALELAQTFEGMRWLAWRCVRDHHPEFARIENRPAFYALIDDMLDLGELVMRLLDFGKDDRSADPPATTEGSPT